MKPENFVSTKTFKSFPCTHRQPAHKGHCKYVHGYDRDFYFHFKCNKLQEETGFVVEFGGLALKELKTWLEYMYDHTFLCNQDDPEIPTFTDLDQRQIIQLRIVPNVSMEATAKLCLEKANALLQKYEGDRAWCYKVEVRENYKNSGIYKKDRE